LKGPGPGAASQTSAGQTGKKNQKKADAKAAKAAKVGLPVEATLVDYFAKAKLVVGLVKMVEELPDSHKLYRCQVQVGGDEKRQVSLDRNNRIRNLCMQVDSIETCCKCHSIERSMLTLKEFI
jgi:hypothetical protein